MLESLINTDIFSNLMEIYISNENTVEVVTQKGRYIRVTAQEVIRGPRSKYSAKYQEKFAIKANIRNPDNHENYKEQHLEIWADLKNMPHEHDDSLEGCLRGAMRWVNERCAGAQLPLN